MNERNGHDNAPRWMRLAATLRAEPAPGTMARVRARLAERAPAPRWLAWLGRPVTLAASAGLLVASAWFGAALVQSLPVYSTEHTTLAAALLEDDGSFGLPLDDGTAPSDAGADSQEVAP